MSEPINLDSLRNRFRQVLKENFTDEERTAIAHHALDEPIGAGFRDIVTRITTELVAGGVLQSAQAPNFMLSLVQPALETAAEAVARVPGLEPMSFDVYSAENLLRDALKDIPDPSDPSIEQ